jgi:hypothetical protein
MIDLSKGLSLFISNDNQNEWTLSSLINFLSDEYTLLSVSFGRDKFGISSIMKKIDVNSTNYQDKIKENLFRVEILVVYIPYGLKGYGDFLSFLRNLNLVVFIITPNSKSVDVLDNCNSYITNFYEVKSNPDYLKSNFKRFSNPITSVEWGSMSDKYLIKNINTDEEFTVSQYRKSYIRDKKIDIFLDDNDQY